MTETGFRNITKAQFENFPLNVWGKSVTRYPVTTTTSHRGNETYSWGSGASITAILQRYSGNPKKARDKEGVFRTVDAYIMCSVDTTVNVNDKIKDTDTNEVYQILTKKNERGLYIFCQMYYLETSS